MKIVFIHQAPHRLHAAWLKSVTNHFYSCVPNCIFSRKRIYDFVYKHTILNQISCLIQTLFIPNADIYVVEGLKTALPAILRKRKGVKIILINSDTFFYNHKKAGFIIKSIYNKFLSYIDGMISTSFFMKQMAEQYSKVPNVVVYPFVQQKYLNVCADIASDNIIFTGRLVKDKGIGILINAFNKIPPEYADKLLLVGKIEEKIDEMKIPNKRIITTGWIENVEDYLQQSSIFVDLATHESFGVSVLEAMTAGVIPIVSKNCGIKELIEPISKDLICDRNSDLLSKKIVWLNSNFKLKQDLSANCKKVASQFTQERSIEEFDNKFKELLGEVIPA